MAAGYYHLHVHPISRGKGQNIHAAMAYRHGTLNVAQAAAAYRRAQQLGNGVDAFDYRRKVGVAWTGVIAPDDAPAWARDAAALWHSVDFVEVRKDARLAQEVVIGLPHQVDLEQHIAMVSTFARHLCVDPYRLVADIAIHAPPVHQGGDPRHWHAHILLTDRPITADGFAKTKDRRTQTTEFILALRQGWTEIHNRHMQSLGLPYRIDDRTLAVQHAEAVARGDVLSALELDREPQIRLGKVRHVRDAERYPAYKHRLDTNRAILTRNKDKACAHKDHWDSLIAQADTTAHLEARQNARTRAVLADALEPSLADLETTYGHTLPSSALGRVRAHIRRERAANVALALSRQHGHPWFATGNRPDAPSIASILLPMARDEPARRNPFTVTAKDIAFAFYTLGFTSLRELRTTLQTITYEQECRRAAREQRPPPPPPEASPALQLPTPAADRLRRLRLAARLPHAIYHQRLGTLQAFVQRYARTNRSRRYAHRRVTHRSSTPP